MSLLGSGAFALTWRAKVVSSDLAEEWGTDEVAVKSPRDKDKERVLIHELIQNATLNNLLRDAASENIIKYFGFEEVGGRYVMVTELARGGNLLRLINPEAPCSLEMAGKIISGVLCGLDAIHRLGIAHCDIKPANVLLADGVPKIGDLGISRFVYASRRGKATVGTTAYLAPEVFATGSTCQDSDLWAAGVLLYELLAGRHPFCEKDSSTEDLTRRICEGKFTPIRSLRPDVSKNLEDLLGVLMNPRPELRRSALPLVGAPAEQQQGQNAGKVAELRARILSQTNDPTIEAAIRSMIEVQPTNSALYELLADLFMNKGRPLIAAKELDAGITACTKPGELYWRRGLAEHAGHEYKAAIESFERACSLGVGDREHRIAQSLIRTIREQRGERR